MIPARHPHASRYLGKPADWTPEDGSCGHLAIADLEIEGHAIMQSIWEPSPAELAELNAGGFVVLTVWGRGHPPVHVGSWARPDGDDQAVPA